MSVKGTTFCFQLRLFSNLCFPSQQVRELSRIEIGAVTHSSNWFRLGNDARAKNTSTEIQIQNTNTNSLVIKQGPR